MPKHITVGGIEYRSRSDVRRRARGILDSVPVGVAISDDDKGFILSLMELRSEDTKREKIGTGVVKITPMWATNSHNCKTFKLIRSNGSYTDFSVNKCIDSDNHASYVKKAARWEVIDQINEFKALNFNAVCSLTGNHINYNECHVDHIPPDTFDVLFATFLQSCEQSIHEIKASNVGDCRMGTVFEDRELAAKWKQYHKQNAKLRIVSQHANLCMVNKLKGKYDR